MMNLSIKALATAGAIGLAAVSPQSAQAGGRTSFSFGIGFGGGHCSSSYFGISSGHYYRGHHYSGHYRSSWHSPSYYYRSYCPPSVIYTSPSVIYTSPPVVYTAPPPAPVVRETIVYTQPRYAYADAVVVAPGNTAQVVAQPATQPMATSSVAPAPAPAPAVQPTFAPPSAPPRDGWALLGANDTRAALDAFAADAERSMQSGIAKVGYALSAAALTDDAKAVWAMRRALLAEPESLNKIPMSPAIQQQVRGVIQRVEARVAEGFSRSDDLFLIASLKFIDAQFPAADAALQRAVAQGDKDQTTTTLRTLIDMKLKGGWNYDYKD